MTQRSRKWIILPFGFGCASRSSVADDAPTDTNHATPTSTEDTTTQSDSSVVKKTDHPLGFRLSKANLSRGIRRFFRNLKSVSQLFVYKDDKEDEDDNDKDEGDMEIGYPTDVKHLTHIGWDGSTTVSKSAKDWENLTPSEIISFPSISLKQFEVAMAKQAAAAAAATATTAADKNTT